MSCWQQAARWRCFWHRPAQTDLTRHTLAPLQAIYAREAPQLTHGFQTPPPPEAVATGYDESIAASGLFTDITIKKRYVATEYTATGYCELLETFSDHQALAADARRRLLAGIEALDRAGVWRRNHPRDCRPALPGAAHVTR